MPTVLISQITTNGRRRDTNHDKVKALSLSIAEVGLINPISLLEDNTLVAGLHRLEAVKMLGHKEIEAIYLAGLSALQAELAEIDENLIRNDLTVLRQGEWLVRRDEVLEEMGLRLKQGDNQFTTKGGEDSSPPKTTANIAKEVGLSLRISQQRKQVATKIIPEAKELIYGTELENQVTNLLYLAKTPAEKQLEITQGLLLEKADDVRRISSKSTNEWWTPQKYLDAAIEVLGSIDVDPASSEQANQFVQASLFYIREVNGLEKDWPGKVWLNPPYGGISRKFASKLVHQFENKITTEAILLVNANSTDTQWFAPLFNYTLCFTNHRIDFNSPNSKAGGSTHGSVFVYLGDNIEAFTKNFKQFGPIVKRIDL